MLADKLRAATAGAEGLPIEDLFSTYLYTGTGTRPRTITNGIDLAGEGGLVWIKRRDGSSGHALHDTMRGVDLRLSTNATNAESDTSVAATGFSELSAFNSDGFDVGNAADVNGSGGSYVSWTFRKAPRFFDIVTYTGTGVGARNIAHNLGVTPGMIVIKRTDSASALGWIVHHRSLGFSNYMWINGTNGAATGSNYVSNADESTFQVGGLADVNASGGQFVAYLFAHNDGDGEFGPNGDQDIIKCGSYTTDSNGFSGIIDIGFEPQFVMFKRTDSTGDWRIIDNMRGFLAAGNTGVMLRANLSNAESSTGYFIPHPNGFEDYGSYAANGSFIYIAIRRGPMKLPESGGDVLAIDTRNATNPGFVSGWPVDAALRRTSVSGGSDSQMHTRMLGATVLNTDSTAAEGTSSDTLFDFMTGWRNTPSVNSDDYSWMFRRAPGFFDVVCDTGTGAVKTVNHSLGVVPDLIIRKRRSSPSENWLVYPVILGASELRLNQTNAIAGGSSWNNTLPTEEVFTVGSGSDVNGSTYTYVNYLFATLPGVSKVGSYTGNGSTQTIDCGFTSGARFVLIKRTDSTGDWYVWDTERGIVTGNDPHLSLNTTAAQVTTDDSIDPDSSGFIVNQDAATNVNVSSATYIYLAIA